MPDTPTQRFLTLDQVAEELSTSKNQVYALVRQGELEAIKVGGRGQWRVERVKLEQYIEHLYEETRQFIQDHPFDQEAEQDADGAGLDDVTGLAAMSNPLPPSAAVGSGGATAAGNAASNGAHSGRAEAELER
jgi:excisionase family DNA binding protein